MNKIFIVFFLLFALGANAQSEMNKTDVSGKKQGHWQKKQDNGKLLYDGTFKDDKPVGEFKRYHSNGVVKALLTYPEQGDTADASIYDKTGKLIAKGQYVNQEKYGQWVSFDKGIRVSSEFYSNGMKNGKAQTFYSTGELFEESDWLNGQETGVYRAYFKSGSPYLECQMLNGKRHGFCQTYFSNGRMELEAFYKEGLRQNVWNYYEEDGTLSYSLIYDLGKIQNPEVQDSIEQIRYDRMAGNKGKIADPEQFMNDPSEYMSQPMSTY